MITGRQHSPNLGQISPVKNYSPGGHVNTTPIYGQTPTSGVHRSSSRDTFYTPTGYSPMNVSEIVKFLQILKILYRTYIIIYILYFLDNTMRCRMSISTVVKRIGYQIKGQFMFYFL